MVGNDSTTDIAVAEAVGIDGILLNTFPYSRRELENSPIKPDRVITDIEALKTNLQKYTLFGKSKDNYQEFLV